MGIPLISEAKQGKELLLEIDSIVPDTTGHHLADVSLSSNDSLSRSRRRWNLIKIVSKMNPNFQGKPKKLIFYQSLSALLSLILTGIMIYWLVQMKSSPNSHELSSSSLLLTSSRSSPPSEPKPMEHFISKPIPVTTSEPNPSKVLLEPLSLDSNPADPSDGSPSLVPIYDADFHGAHEGIFEETNEDDENDDDTFNVFGPPLPYRFFQSSPRDFVRGHLSPPQPLPKFQEAGIPIISAQENGAPMFDLVFKRPDGKWSQWHRTFQDITPNFEKITSSAQNLHASAITAFDDLLSKLKAGPFGDFLSIDENDFDTNDDDSLETEMIRSSDSPSESTDQPIDRVFNFIKKIGF